MPKATQKFPYEFRVLQGMGYLHNKRFKDKAGTESFIAGLDSQGRVIQSISSEDEGWSLDSPDMRDAYAASVMIDIIEHGEYIYLSWRNIPKHHLETLLDIQFESTDFVSERYGTTEYPLSHSVMF